MEESQSQINFKLKTPIIWLEEIKTDAALGQTMKNNLLIDIIEQENLKFTEKNIVRWNIISENNKIILKFVFERQDYQIESPIEYINNFSDVLRYVETYLLSEEENISQLMHDLREKEMQIDIFFQKNYSKNLDVFRLKKLIFHKKYNEAIQILFMINFLATFSYSNEETPAVIIGPNGVGKTKLINFLAQDIFASNTKIKVLKANINLEFILNNYNSTKSFDQINQQDQSNQNMDVNISTYIVSLISDRNNLLSLALDKGESVNKNNFTSKLDILILIFKRIFPDFEVHIDVYQNCLLFSKNQSEKFHWNQLSDGEKKVLWMLAKIVIADSGSWIFVDEPETHLNPAIFQKFWTEILKHREDCKFIFITHHPEMLSILKSHSDLFLLNKFIALKTLNISPIKNIDELDSDALIKIYGKKGKILFCEGNLDFKIYSEAFDDYQVIPMNGKTEVIKAVKAIEKLNHHSMEAFGIIDSDESIFRNSSNQKNQDKVIKLKNYNEIEMLLLDDSILRLVLEDAFPKEKQNIELKLADINKKIINHFKDSIDLIIERNKSTELDFLKKNLPIKLQSNETIDAALTNFKKQLENLNNQSEIKKRELFELANKNDKNAILKICSLKELVTEQFVGIPRYVEKVINFMQREPKLSQQIRLLINIEAKK